MGARVTDRRGGRVVYAIRWMGRGGEFGDTEDTGAGRSRTVGFGGGAGRGGQVGSGHQVAGQRQEVGGDDGGADVACEAVLASPGAAFEAVNWDSYNSNPRREES